MLGLLYAHEDAASVAKRAVGIDLKGDWRSMPAWDWKTKLSVTCCRSTVMVIFTEKPSRDRIWA